MNGGGEEGKCISLLLFRANGDSLRDARCLARLHRTPFHPRSVLPADSSLPATQNSDLKKAFHSLSLKTHPDRPGGSTASFQLVQEAYDVLSDPNDRATYDESLQEPQPGFGFDMFDRGGGGRQQQPRREPKRKSRSSNVEISITLEELFKGAEKKLSIQRDRCCATCTG